MSDIIYKHCYFGFPKNDEEKDHYEKHYKSGRKLRYITRRDATYNLTLSQEELERLELIKNDDFSLYQKELKELRNTIKLTTGLYGKNGLYTKEQFDVLEERYSKLKDKQHVWDCILSFSQDFTKKNKVYSPNGIYKQINQSIETMLRQNKIDPKYINYHWSFQIDTQNPHIHLMFFEEKPTYIEKIRKEQFFNKQINRNQVAQRKFYQYRKRGNFKIDTMELFKFDINKKISLDRNIYHDLQEKKKDLKNSLFSQWKKMVHCDTQKSDWISTQQVIVDAYELNKPIEEKISDLKDRFRDIKKINNINYYQKDFSYNSKYISDDVRELMKDIIYSLIDVDQNISEKYHNYKNVVNGYGEELKNVYKPYAINLKRSSLNKDNLDLTIEKEAEIKKQHYIDRQFLYKTKNNKYFGLIPEIANKFISELINQIKNEDYLEQYKSKNNQKLIYKNYYSNSLKWTRQIRWKKYQKERLNTIISKQLDYQKYKSDIKYKQLKRNIEIANKNLIYKFNKGVNNGYKFN